MLFCTMAAGTNRACRYNIRLNAFEFFTFVKSHFVIFWVMIIYGLAGGVHCFGMKCCFHSQAWDTCQVIVHAVVTKAH
jgi:hypothetical protein